MDGFGSVRLQIDHPGTTRFSSVLWEAEIAGHEMRMAKYTPYTIFSIFRPKSPFAIILRPYFASFLLSKLHLLPVPEGITNHVLEISHFSKYTNWTATKTYVFLTCWSVPLKIPFSGRVQEKKDPEKDCISEGLSRVSKMHTFYKIFCCLLFLYTRCWLVNWMTILYVV